MEFKFAEPFAVLISGAGSGGGSYINAGAWIHPSRVDWDGFAKTTGVVGWSRETFANHFEKVEGILSVRRDPRDKWNAASVLYEQTALSMGIPVFGTATNRRGDCLYCGHNNAGMPWKYDVLMSTAFTQIPKALGAGAQLVDNATVVRVEINILKLNPQRHDAPGAP